MKKIVTILYLLSTNLFFCQKSGTVHYMIKTIDFVPKEMSHEIDVTIKMAKKQTFILKFNNLVSSEFKQEDLVKSDDDDNEFGNYMATMRFTCDYSYFTNNIEKVEYYKKNDGAIIKNNFANKNWEVTTESKIIDKYLCYKAIFKYNYIARDKKQKRELLQLGLHLVCLFHMGQKITMDFLD